MKGESNGRDLEVEGWVDKLEAAMIAAVIRWALNNDLRKKRAPSCGRDEQWFRELLRLDESFW